MDNLKDLGKELMDGYNNFVKGIIKENSFDENYFYVAHTPTDKYFAQVFYFKENVGYITMIIEEFRVTFNFIPREK